MQRKIMPDIVKKQAVSSLKIDNTVLEAATMMTSANVAAIVVIDDDGMDSNDLTGMIKAYDETGKAQIMVETVPKELTYKYGIVALEGDEPAAGESAPLTGMVEKPKVEEAPSTLAVIGRYLLPGEIFPILAETPPGAGNEIQLTDAIETLRKKSGAAAYRMQGQTYDCGSQLGYLEATLALGRKHPTLGEGFRQLIKQYAAED